MKANKMTPITHFYNLLYAYFKKSTEQIHLLMHFCILNMFMFVLSVYTWLPTCQMWPPSYLHNTTLLCLLPPPQTLPCSPDDSAATALTTVMSTWTMNVLRGSERAKLEKSDITSCDYVSQVWRVGGPVLAVGGRIASEPPLLCRVQDLFVFSSPMCV